ncbi:MFS transporter [Halomarina pelagica]|uniref:MFS transporter n=1 Tax=Halomarina pelagica TaxID=2961599 RepID=UPI0020C2FA97|nr:MFS transporter [Halomarina sp. BND7]
MTANENRRERIQRFAIGVAAAANKGRAVLMGTAMAVYIGQVGTPLAVSLVFTVYWFGLMVFSPVAGAVADVTGRRRAVLVGTALLSTLAVLPLVVVDGVRELLAFRGLFAVFAAGFLPVMLAIVSDRGGAEARGQSLGFFNSTQAVGFTLAQFFAGVLLGLVAPWTLYLVVAAVSASVAVAVVFVRDPTPPNAGSPTLAELTAEVRTRLLPARADRDHLANNGLKWLYVAVLLRNMTVLGTSSLLPIYLVGEIGVTEFVMGTLLAINPAAQMLFMYLFGHVADASGRKPLIVYGMAGAGVHALIVTAAVVPASVPVRAVVVAASFLVLAAAYSSETTGTYAFIGDVSPEERGSELMGLHSTARGLGGVVGPVVVGGLATLFGYEVAFVSGSLLAFAATALVARSLVESYPTARRRGHVPVED